MCWPPMSHRLGSVTKRKGTVVVCSDGWMDGWMHCLIQLYSGCMHVFRNADLCPSLSLSLSFVPLHVHSYRSQRAGSMPLRHAVESSPNQPALWLCGHIHEGRGAVWYPFRKDDNEPTVGVNAANANTGRARRLVTGPVLIDLVAKPPTVSL